MMDPRVFAAIKGTMIQTGIDQIRSEKAGNEAAAKRYYDLGQALCAAYPDVQAEASAGLLAIVMKSIRGNANVH